MKLENISANKNTANEDKSLSSFWRLYIGTFVSHLGTNISILVLPTYAITYLQASTQEVAAITFAQALPRVLFSFWVGSRVDKIDPKRLIVITDVISALLSFICAYWLYINYLQLPMLYIVVFFLALLSIVYNVSTQALVPILLKHDQVLWGNSRLYAGKSIATVLGQIAASKLTVIAFGALAMALDAISHIIRAFMLLPIINVNEKVNSEKNPQNWILDTRDTASFFQKKPELIRLIGTVATFNFGGAFILAFFFQYAYETLKLTPFHLGIAFGVGSVSATAGAMMASKWSNSDNLVRRGQQFFALCGIALWLILLATKIYPFTVLIIYEIIFNFCSAVFYIALTTRQHHIVSIDFQGRVGAISLFMTNLMMLFASGLATVSAYFLTPTQGVLIGCCFSLLTFLWFFNWKDNNSN